MIIVVPVPVAVDIVLDKCIIMTMARRVTLVNYKRIQLIVVRFFAQVVGVIN